MTARISRRQLLQRGAAFGAFLAAAGGIPAARSAWRLAEQHQTWSEASLPNDAFFARHAADLQRLTLGGSFAPEQWAPDLPGQRLGREALRAAVQDLGMRQMRFGTRWDRLTASGGGPDLSPYGALIDYCLASDVEVCINVGPIRVFRWPEEHVPARVLQALPSLPGDIVELDSPLATVAIDHLQQVLRLLQRAYGDRIATLQLENEPFFAMGPHRWRMSQDYMAALFREAAAIFPAASLLVTSAGRLNLEQVRGLFQRLLREEPALDGRLVSGFDFHYKTPLRASVPVVRHFDQVAYGGPFAPSPTRHVWDSRDFGFKIEVSEAQAEPFGQFDSPGNSARDFRFLLLRCLDRVLDPLQPALIRIWGVEKLTERMVTGNLTDEHRDIIAIIQHVNGNPDGPSLRR